MREDCWMGLSRQPWNLHKQGVLWKKRRLQRLVCVWQPWKYLQLTHGPLFKALSLQVRASAHAATATTWHKNMWLRVGRTALLWDI